MFEALQIDPASGLRSGFAVPSISSPAHTSTHQNNKMMQITLSHFNRTGGDAGFDREMSGGDLLSGESIIKESPSNQNTNFVGTPTGNVV